MRVATNTAVLIFTDIDQFVAITHASPEDAQHFLSAGTTLEVRPPALDQYRLADTD